MIETSTRRNWSRRLDFGSEVWERMMKGFSEWFVSLKSYLTMPTALKVTGILLLSLFFFPIVLEDSNKVQRFLGAYLPTQADFSPTGLVDEPVAELIEKMREPVAELIEKIREAVRVAANGTDVRLSTTDRRKWEEQNPCRSRSELRPIYAERKHVKDVPENRRWQKVLDEYAVLHRVCMSKIGDPKMYFLTKNDSTGCKFLITEAHYGLGNKLLHMSSLLVYAVLTQRVMLIPVTTTIPPILCEPFVGSYWGIHEDVHHSVRGNRTTSKQLYVAMDNEIAINQSRKMGIYASMGGNEWGPDSRFYCDTEQSWLSDVTWLTFDGCMYVLPALFSIGAFRPAMEAIFPDRIVLTHVLRTVMLPGDPVWDRVLKVKQVYLENADKQVGVQVRFLHGENQYRKLNTVFNEHISRCLWENDVLPALCASEEEMALNSTDGNLVNCSSSLETSIDTSRNSAAPPVTKVLIASLFLGFHDYLTDIYVRRVKETVRQESIGIVQLTHEKTQGTGVEVDSQALVEIFSLSFSDVLVVTPFSTFGGVAQSYGGLVPYFFEGNVSSPINCERGLSTEPCDLGGGRTFDCRYDDVKRSRVRDTVPYLQYCQAIDIGGPESGILMMNEDQMTEL